jgi:hypothetical protein
MDRNGISSRRSGMLSRSTVFQPRHGRIAALQLFLGLIRARPHARGTVFPTQSLALEMVVKAALAGAQHVQDILYAGFVKPLVRILFCNGQISCRFSSPLRMATLPFRREKRVSRL